MNNAGNIHDDVDELRHDDDDRTDSDPSLKVESLKFLALWNNNQASILVKSVVHHSGLLFHLPCYCQTPV